MLGTPFHHGIAHENAIFLAVLRARLLDTSDPLSIAGRPRHLQPSRVLRDVEELQD